MNAVTGCWCPVVASSEVARRPVARTRFGQQLVFWRSGEQVVCMPDRCPHRGAALSLGRIENGALACRFHGLEFSAEGRCVGIPVEADMRIPEDFCVPSLPVAEANGYLWLWRGPAPVTTGATETRPPVPRHPELEGLSYGESTTIWPAHYTRCIENVCDFSHLPFVHRTTIGMGKRDRVTRVETEDLPGGFRAYLLRDGERAQYIEFLYPNLWLLMVSKRIMMSAVFVPIDDDHTAVYGRSYYESSLPGIKWLMDGYTWLSQYLVFREDWPIVASQTPGDVRQAQHEKLLPSDAPVIAYRKLHRAYSEI
jgi:phenylpropionate dioxygenase-like ring-hydroxylating dioxygenase large terminal subunit